MEEIDHSGKSFKFSSIINSSIFFDSTVNNLILLKNHTKTHRSPAVIYYVFIKINFNEPHNVATNNNKLS